MCCKRYYIIFSTFSLNFKCQICVQKEVIHNFQNHIWVTCPTYRFSKEKSYNFIFIKTMSHDFLVKMAKRSSINQISRRGRLAVVLDRMQETFHARFCGFCRVFVVTLRQKTLPRTGENLCTYSNYSCLFTSEL